MIPKSLLLAATALGLATSAASFARPPFAGPEAIDIAAVEKKAVERLAELDADSNGSISEAEFLDDKSGPMGHPGSPGGFHWRRCGPGPMGGPEFEIDLKAVEDDVFNQLDADDNASLSRQEFSQENVAAARHKVFRTHLFRKLDTNNDNALSADEMPSPGEHLRQVDADGDGKVTSEERRAAWSKAPAGSMPPECDHTGGRTGG